MRRSRPSLPAGLLALFACFLLAGCAPKGPSPHLVAEIAKADALFGRAATPASRSRSRIFEKHAQAKLPLPGAPEGAFDAALLIAIREKELGIPATIRSVP